MKKLILASAALMATFGMETGITPVDNVVKGVFAQTAEAQSQGQTWCNLYNNFNRGGTNRFASTRGTLNRNLGSGQRNQISSVRVRVRGNGGSDVGSLIIYDRTNQRDPLNITLVNVSGTSSSDQGNNLSSGMDNRAESFRCEFN